MAEYVLKDMVSKRGREDEFRIESAATSAEEIGNGVHSGTVNILRANGIETPRRHARQITHKDYDDFDMIIGMDDRNMRNMRLMFNGDPDDKLYKLMEFVGDERDVADPWYTGDFKTTFEDISASCEGLLDRLTQSGSN